MRKIGFMLGAFAVSLCCHAGSASLSTDMKSAILNNSATQSNSTSNPSMIYGGQDISRRVVATANESLWAGQPHLIG
jgi:hypothetical protein